MGARKNIFAFTPPGASPPYASINREEDETVTLHVRGVGSYEEASGPGSTHFVQPAASIVLTDEAFLDLFFAVGEHIFGPVIMQKAGRVALETAAQVADAEDASAAAGDAP